VILFGVVRADGTPVFGSHSNDSGFVPAAAPDGRFPFRLRLPYYFPESGGPDLRVSLRSGGPIAIESVALVPPDEPENVLRLP